MHDIETGLLSRGDSLSQQNAQISTSFDSHHHYCTASPWLDQNVNINQRTAPRPIGCHDSSWRGTWGGCYSNILPFSIARPTPNPTAVKEMGKRSPWGHELKRPSPQVETRQEPWMSPSRSRKMVQSGFTRSTVR